MQSSRLLARELVAIRLDFFVVVVVAIFKNYLEIVRDFARNTRARQMRHLCVATLNTYL